MVVGKVVAVDDATISTVGQGSSANLPTAISAPPLTKDGKPLVLYVGAEYCPFCAAQRWAVVQALSRFGTFTGLTLTHSDPKDSFPNTPTFTFHGATYTSSVVAFEGVETQTVDHKPLDTLTSDQEALFTKYNAPPYVPASAQGAIPFIYFGGSYVLSGRSTSASTARPILRTLTPGRTSASPASNAACAHAASFRRVALAPSTTTVTAASAT